MFFFFNDTATTEIYTLSLHDALPIWSSEAYAFSRSTRRRISNAATRAGEIGMECLGELLAQSLATGEMIAVHKVASCRSEEHTSELQSQSNLVCRLLLEKKKTIHHEY